MSRSIRSAAVLLPFAALPALAQQPFSKTVTYTPTSEERQQLDQKEKQLADRLHPLTLADKADAAVFLHLAEVTDRLGDYANKGQVATILRGLDIGLQRCDLLAKGETPWRTRPGRSIRGYVSRIDGSIQPYIVVLPASFDPKATKPWRLDVVLHGRGTIEPSFLQSGEPTRNNPPDQPFLELQPFGRANNGWRWSGEADVFEALEQVKKQYPIDPDRTILRGFSMGGHGAWHIGVHHSGLWASVSPGAGFTETRNYAKIPPGSVPAYQEKAWHIYDSIDYALNIFNTPFIAYGGEIDPQLQASLNMKEAAAAEGLPLNLIVGPKTAHAYQPDSFKEIMRQLSTAQRNPQAKELRFVTWTLKYNRCKWVTVDGLQEHYRRAEVRATTGSDGVQIKTVNVAALTLDSPPAWPLTIDGQKLLTTSTRAPLHLSLVRANNKWQSAPAKANPKLLQKVHDLQGPIDDAFTQRFVVVRGTGTTWTPATAAYVDRTLRHFQDDWRLGFRGEAPLKDDRDVSPEDWLDSNLVLFGDPASNRVLAKIVDRLPLKWTKEGIVANGRHYGPDSIPVLVYPNPLNPRHYVVINSGHTFGKKEILASNVWLFPQLPDWAIVRPAPTTSGADATKPEVQAAGYFDETWHFKPERSEGSR